MGALKENLNYTYAAELNTLISEATRAANDLVAAAAMAVAAEFARRVSDSARANLILCYKDPQG